MSNSLTGFDVNIYSLDFNRIENIKSNFSNNKESEQINSNKSFKELLSEKINKNGTINENKLDKKEKKLYKACEDMESLIWKQMLNEMKKTINKYRLVEMGPGEEIFTDFLYDEYASMLAKNGKTGLKDEIFKQLSGLKNL